MDIIAIMMIITNEFSTNNEGSLKETLTKFTNTFRSNLK